MEQKISSKSKLPAIEMKGNVRTVEEYVKLLVDMEASPKCDGKVKNEWITGAADALVSGFEDSDMLASKRPELRADMLSVQRSVESVCSGEFDAALDAVRGVKIDSIFSHWKLFVKGMVAFYTDNAEKALAAFNKLPAGSIPCKAAESFLLILNKDAFKNATGREQAAVHNMAVNMFFDHDYAKIIFKADRLWRDGRYAESFNHMINNHPGFPSENSGVAAHLTRFYFNAAIDMDQEIGEKYMRSLTPHKPDNSLRRFLSLKASAMMAEKHGENEHIVDYWESALKTYASLHGDNNDLAAMVYCRLGLVFTRENVEMNPFPFFNSEKDHKSRLKIAIKFYEKSISLNDKDKAVYMFLLKVYEIQGLKSKYNKFLDEMVKMFPDEKSILFRAGIVYASNKSYVKGLSYLEAALKLDPLDMNTRKQIILCCLNIARASFKKKKLSNGRDSFKRAIECGSAKSVDFNFGHVYLYVRLGALELIYGEDDAAYDALKKTETFDVPLSTSYYFTMLIIKAYGGNDSAYLTMEKRFKSVVDKSLDNGMILQLLEVFHYVSMLDDFDCNQSDLDLLNLLAGKATKSKKTICSRETAKKIILLVVPYKEGTVSTFFHDFKIAKLYIKKMLKEDKEDPFFLFYELKIDLFLGKADVSSSTAKRGLKILNIATERKDLELVKEIKSDLDRLNLEVSNSFFDDDYEDEDFDDMDIAKALDEELARLFLEVLEDACGSSGKKGKSSKKGKNKKRKGSSGFDLRDLFLE